MCRTLQMLVDRGYLEKENDIARGYKVILDESEWNVVPGIPSNITIREERQMDEEEPDLKEYEIKAAAYQRIRYRREIRDAVVRCEWKLVVELGQRLMKLGHE